MSRIIDYASDQPITADDVFLIDGAEGGSRAVTMRGAAEKMVELSGIGGEVAQLKEDFNEFKKGVVKKNIIENKYINEKTGSYTNYNGWSIIDYIDISGFEKLIVESTESSIYNAFYTKNKEFVSNFETVSGKSIIDIPDTAVYVALSNTNAAIANTVVYDVAKVSTDLRKFENNNQTFQEKVTGIENAIAKNVSTNIYGVIYAQTGGTIQCTGKARANSYYLCSDNSSVPDFASGGKPFKVYYQGTENVRLDIIEHYNDSTQTIINSVQSFNGVVVVDSEATSLTIRIGVASGTTVDESVTLLIYSGMTNNDIKNQISPLPDYYYVGGWIDERINAIKTASRIINGQTFAFMTDPHFASNDLNSKYLLKTVLNNTTVPMVICGGDIVGLYGTEDELVKEAEIIVDYQNYIGKNKFFTTRGNHDFYVKKSAETSNISLSEAQAYDLICRNCEPYVSDMFPEHMCYVIKNDAQNTVIVMVNSKDASGAVQSNITGEQAEWLCDILTKYKDKNIVCVSHIPADQSFEYAETTQAIVHIILSAFNAKETIDRNHKTAHLIADFTTATGSVICHISGHTHSDEYHFSDGVLSITTTCDAHYQDDGYHAVSGTVTEQAFDVFCIDYDNKTVKTVRIGRGNSRAWNYITGEPIS